MALQVIEGTATTTADRTAHNPLISPSDQPTASIPTQDHVEVTTPNVISNDTPCSAQSQSGDLMLAAARCYAGSGWFVLPLWWIKPGTGTCACPAGSKCTSPAKHPITKNGVHDATIDQEQVTSWWTRWPRAGIGIATEPSNLIVVDFDAKYGGLRSLAKLRSQNWWPKTISVNTGGGGVHAFFASTTPMPNGSKILDHVNLPGVDIRSRGGYVVAAPSGHISGGTYAWDRDFGGFLGHLAEYPTALAELRTWRPAAARRVARPDRSIRAFTAYAEAALENELDNLRRVQQGGRNDALNEAAFSLGTLVGAGLLTEATVYESLVGVAMCWPNLETKSIPTIVRAIAAGTTFPRTVTVSK